MLTLHKLKIYEEALAWQKAYEAMRAKSIVLLPRPPEEIGKKMEAKR